MIGDDLRDDLLQPSALELGFVWLYRIIAIYCLAFGLYYWVRLIGYHEGTHWRFDLMPYYWQAAAASLAVLYPIAAIGLWMTASWGPVIWVCCAVAEAIMFLLFDELFGARYEVVAAHAVVALTFTGFRLGIHLQKRRASL